MNGYVTMADIAKRAGVHVTTVSLALRNHPSLPEATRERLRKLAESMGYRPDPGLRALMSYRRNLRQRREVQTLAYVTNWDTRWAWKEFPAHVAFFNGASERAQELGYAFEHFWLGEPQLCERRLGDILYARGIGGMVLASHRYDKDVRLDFDWSRLAAVKIVDYFPHEPQLHIVTNDQRSILRLAMRQVMAAGYERVGLVLHADWDFGSDFGMSMGFIEAQQAVQPSERIPICYIEKSTPPPDEQWGGRAPSKALGAWIKKHRPDAVIGFGPAVLPQLQELGIEVPRDIAFADLFLTPTDGSIAGVRHNCQRVGALAVELLAGQLQTNSYGLPLFPTTTLVAGTWIDGRSLPVRVPTAN